MKVYAGCLLISEIFTLWSIKTFRNYRNDRANYFFAVLSVVPFILVSGLQYRVGADYLIYNNAFYYIKDTGYYNLFEPGYNLLNKIVGIFSDSSVALFMVCAIFFCGFSFISIHKLSCNIYASIFIWVLSQCFFESMNTVRQSLSVSIVFISFIFILKKKMVPYILCILFATSMHYSAIIMLPVYFIDKMKLNWKKQLMFSGAILLIAFFARDIITEIPLFERYVSLYVRSNRNFVDFTLTDCIIAISGWLTGAYYYSRISEENRASFHLFYNLQWMYVLSTVISAFVPLAYRITMYFMYSCVFLYPIILKSEKRKYNRIVAGTVLYGLFIAKLIIYAYFIGNRDYVEYQSVISLY